MTSYPTVYYVKPELKFEEIILKHHPRSKGVVDQPGTPLLTAFEYFKQEPRVLEGAHHYVIRKALTQEFRSRFHYDEIYFLSTKVTSPGTWMISISVPVVNDYHFIDLKKVTLTPSSYRQSLKRIERRISLVLTHDVLSDIKAIYKIACYSLRQEAEIRGLSYGGIEVRVGLYNNQYVSVYHVGNRKVYSAVEALRLLHDGNVLN